MKSRSIKHQNRIIIQPPSRNLITSALSLKNDQEHLNSPKYNKYLNRISFKSAYNEYAEIWKRARFKLNTVYIFNKLIEHQRLYGTGRGPILMPFFEETENKKLVSRATKILIPYHDLPTNESTPFGIIHPNSWFKAIWNIIVVLLLLYTASFTPFVLAFIDITVNDSIFWVENVVTILFFLDFIVNFSSAYYNKEKILIIHRGEIALKYIKSWMIIDFLAWFPIDQIVAAGNSNDSLSKFVRIPKLYRLVRISRLLKLLKSHFQIEMLEKLQDYFSIKSSGIRLFRSFLAIVISIHIMSCFWYLSSKLYNFSPDTWVVRYNYQDSDIASLYITSIYWAVTTFATVGYGDITPNTKLELLICLSWMTIGIYFFAFTISSLNSMLSSMNLKDNLLENKLAVIEEFSIDSHLAKELTWKLKRSLKYSANKRGFSWTEKLNLINEFPKDLRYEIAVNMHHGAAKILNFFSNKEKSFIALTVPLLEPVCVEKDCWIFKTGDFADEIYFITKGKIKIVIEDTIEIKSIQQADYFGDIELFRNIMRRYSAIATRFSECLTMNKSLINQIKESYYNIWEDMLYNALEEEKNYERVIIEIKEFEKHFNGIIWNKNALNNYKARVKSLLSRRFKELNEPKENFTIVNISFKIDKLIKLMIEKNKPDKIEILKKMNIFEI